MDVMGLLPIGSLFMGESDPHRRLTLIVAYAITAVWSLSFLYDLFGPQDYEPNVALTPLMLTVATFAFGGGLLKRKNGNHEQQ